MAKFLDEGGVNALWEKAKEHTDASIAGLPVKRLTNSTESPVDLDTLMDHGMYVFDGVVPRVFSPTVGMNTPIDYLVVSSNAPSIVNQVFVQAVAGQILAVCRVTDDGGESWTDWMVNLCPALDFDTMQLPKECIPAFTAADVGARPSTWKPTPTDIVREGYTAAGLDPIAAAMIGSAASNKTFGLPAEAITVEYSNDGGATWEDYRASSSVKFALFAELRDSPIYLGKRSATVAADPANAQTTGSMLRVTIVPSDRYVSFNSIYCWLSTAGNKCQAKIESSTIGEKTTFSELKGWTTVSGWAGNNIIYFRSGTFGGGESQPTNHYAYRVTFRNTSINAVSGNAYINDIRFLGVDAWVSPNNMVGRNRLYKWDADLTAIFEKSISGEQLIARAAEGTPPLVVGSTTAVPKLNADLVDGKHAGDFAEIDHAHVADDVSFADGETFQSKLNAGKLNGADGKSAYQQAVDAGYTGTEAAFYAALVSMKDAPFLPLSGGTMTGVLNMGGKNINGILGLNSPAPYEAIQVGPVNFVTSITTDGGIPVDLGGCQVQGVDAPTNPTDGANKAYVDAETAKCLPLAGGTVKYLGIIDDLSLSGPTTDDGFYILGSRGVVNEYQSATFAGLAGDEPVRLSGIYTPAAPTDAANKEYVDGKMLVFENVQVPVSLWSGPGELISIGYPLTAEIPCAGVTNDCVPSVMFNIDEALDSNFAPVAATHTGHVRIFCKTRPTATITIPSIVCIKGA